MRNARAGTALVLGLATAACPENRAPGNDRESALASPEPAAELSTAGAATQNVAVDLLFPQTMTGADLANVPEGASRCLFRFTRVGLPVVAYDSDAVLKLNGHLVPLPGAGADRYATEGVTLTLRPLDAAPPPGEAFQAELVLRLADASDELGFRGYSTCDGTATG